MAKKLPEYNASSLADIAFMLLIFFLVTTTMDVDSGLRRKLPPMAPEEQEASDIKVKDRNVFEVMVNKNDQLLVEGKLMNIGELKAAAKEFMANRDNDPDLPEFKDTEVPYFGIVPVTKGVISLQNDVGTTYGTYIDVQNELAAAINELRDERAKIKWGRLYEDLNSEQQKAIKKIIPQRISEAEPKKVGGK